MPFVLGHEILLSRPTKRRKLANAADMAKIAGMVNEKSTSSDDGHGSDRCDGDASSGHTPDKMSPIRTSSREELIECIKRGEKPMWVPRSGLQALYEEEAILQEKRKAQSASDTTVNIDEGIQSKKELGNTTNNMVGMLGSTEPIERPRSALHRGDFRDDVRVMSDDTDHVSGQSIEPRSPSAYSTSPPPWLLPHLPSFGRAISDLRGYQTSENDDIGRRRAPSLGSSLSSSFVARVPTSPLVHATSNPYLDTPASNDLSNGGDFQGKNVRRRTMPPHSFQAAGFSPIELTPPNFSRPLRAPQLHRDLSLPHQTHTSRRSVTSVTYQPYTSPQSILTRPRRLSSASDVSPRTRASLVGSFEESILRGRMSMPASQPLGFVAQIGVMGRGDCHSSLKCPAHVSVPFPAVFYNYTSVNGLRSFTDDAPSPYVGTVDLERYLKPVYLANRKRRAAKSHHASDDDPFTESNSEHNRAGRSSTAHVGECRSRDTSPRFRVGGAYRVPQQGQLQIIIKNPNKTAVKLFLVPYDLQGMEPETKTFVRQRSFSSGPIIDNVLGEKTDKGNSFDPLENKHILRYLIHLKFCCPTRGKFYLHDNIRVVFANRVPDGKEKLRNEIQLPDPRFSIYKPARGDRKPPSDFHDDHSARPIMTSSLPFFGDLDGIGESGTSDNIQDQLRLKRAPIPFHLPATKPWQEISAKPQICCDSTLPNSIFEFADASNRSCNNNLTYRQAMSPVPGFLPSPAARGSPSTWSSHSGPDSIRSFSPAPVEAGDGLLSRQFKELNSSAHSVDRGATTSPVPRVMSPLSASEVESSADSGLVPSTTTTRRLG